MDIVLDSEVVKVIDEYMERHEPMFYGLERYCTMALGTRVRQIFREKCVRRMVRLKGEPRRESEWDKKFDVYFDGNSAINLMPVHYYGGRWGYKYFLAVKCQGYFERHDDEIITAYISNRWGDDESAVQSTVSFLELCNDFAKWFNERREEFLKEMSTAIEEIKKFQMSEKPQSHGGVANLLKVLTKTMEKQGADIKNIAKVQYAVCIQAGIYIPDEFVQDVAVAMNIIENEIGGEINEGKHD